MTMLASIFQNEIIQTCQKTGLGTGLLLFKFYTSVSGIFFNPIIVHFGKIISWKSKSKFL